MKLERISNVSVEHLNVRGEPFNIRVEYINVQVKYFKVRVERYNFIGSNRRSSGRTLMFGPGRH